MDFFIWSSVDCLESESNFGNHFSGFLGRVCLGPSTTTTSWSRQGLAGLFWLAIKVGFCEVLEVWEDSKDELSWSKDSPPEGGGEGWGGEGGSTNPPIPRMSDLDGSTKISHNV